EGLANDGIEVGGKVAVRVRELAEVHEQVRPLFVTRDVRSGLCSHEAFELPNIPLARLGPPLCQRNDRGRPFGNRRSQRLRLGRRRPCDSTHPRLLPNPTPRLPPRPPPP